MYRSLLPPLLLLLVIGCTKVSSSLDCPSREANALPSTGNFVMINQVRDFAEKVFHTTKANDKIEYTIEPMRYAEGDTIAYIINTNGHGWKILSADSRTPAILAEDYRGSFSLTDGNPGIRIWIDCMKADMAAVRRASDDQLKFSEEEIAAHKAFWNTYTPRIELPPDTPWPGSGRWETHLISTEEIPVDSVMHMAPEWDQNEPYNVYCPLKSWSLDRHVPAGCVAIAGAQVLYCLHYKLGIPEKAYGLLSWNGNTPIYGLPSSSNWDMMSFSYCPSGTADKEAILIQRAGYFTSMHYADTASSTSHTHLRTDFFPEHGISCSQHSYSQDTVKKYLITGAPVIVSAYDSMLFGSGHCFAIDGYKRTKIKSTYYHIYVTDDPGASVPEGYETVSYSAPEIVAIKINWGWWDQWNPYFLNDGWYTLTGDWVTEDLEENSTHYNYYRDMIYGFTSNN